MAKGGTTPSSGGIDLKTATVLISNDDGIHAPGIKSLEKVLKPLAKRVVVVAPEDEQSATSHSLTLRRPLRVRKVSKDRYAVDGTPTDAVLLGVAEVLGGEKPDLLLSGINRGGNLGEDVTYSGTVACAIEGTLLGIPSIALSQQTYDRTATKWSTAEHWLPTVLAQCLKFDFPDGVLLNVNFPDVHHKEVAGIEVASQGKRKLGGRIQEGKDPRGERYFWIGVERDEDAFKKGTDLNAARRNMIAVSPLTTDMTHRKSLTTLKGLIG